MAHIKIDLDGLSQYASTLNAHIQSYESLCSRTSALTERISGSWQGDASNAYLEMMQKYIQQGRKMIGILKEFYGYATNATSDFDTVDRQCASLIRNSF